MDNIDEYIDKLLDEDGLEDSLEMLEKKAEYTSLLTDYLAKRHVDIMDDYNDLVSREFQISDDFDTKNKVLKDALEKGISLEQSEFYPDLQEGVKLDSEKSPRSV